jgi:hypothetical protein
LPWPDPGAKPRPRQVFAWPPGAYRVDQKAINFLPKSLMGIFNLFR